LQLATNDHYDFYILWTIGIMVFYATFNNISVVLWLSVLLVEETGLPGENLVISSAYLVGVVPDARRVY
jgi:hypothetical protein